MDLEKKNILFVDDDQRIFDLTSRFLCREYNFEIEYASNGQQGLNFFSNNEYDLIITDYEMPIMNGMDLIDNIRCENKKIPIILITGNREIDFNVEAMVIFKPYGMDELKKTINYLC